MINENTYSDAVYDIQSALAELSRHYRSIPRIVPDGIYGDETAAAVAAFQAMAGLPQTGNTDIRTHSALFDYLRKVTAENAAPLPITPFEAPLGGGVLSPGDKGEIVCILQTMLLLISAVHDPIGDIAVTGIYDEVTEEAVKMLQLAGGAEPNGIVDILTWNIIARLFNHYVKYPM